MFNFFSRPFVLTLGGIGIIAFVLYVSFSSSTSTTTNNLPPATNTSTATKTNTPTATLTFTPTLTLTPTSTFTLAPSQTRTSTSTATAIPPTFTSTFTVTPSVLTASINGCDVTNRRIEVVGLPANTRVGMTVKLPSGATYTLQSVSNDGHGWIANVSAEAIKANCPATATPKPSSSGGGSSGGTGAPDGSPQQSPPKPIPCEDTPGGCTVTP